MPCPLGLAVKNKKLKEDQYQTKTKKILELVFVIGEHPCFYLTFLQRIDLLEYLLSPAWVLFALT